MSSFKVDSKIVTNKEAFRFEDKLSCICTILLMMINMGHSNSQNFEINKCKRLGPYYVTG